MTGRTPGGRTGTKGVARAEREAQILAVAGEVFAERGAALASVAEIAERAGISKPLIYNYFGSREGLLTACVGHAAEVIVAEIERTAGLGEVGLARALLTLDGMFVLLGDRPWMWRLVNDATLGAVGEAAEVIAPYRSKVDALAHDGVGQLMHLAGDDDEADVSALVAVWTSVFDSLVGWWLDHPGTSPAEMSARCVRLFTAVFGLGAPPEIEGLSG
ncbi:MAG: TetR/AcrR family transcriptional regulator [Nocardioidaceae bacterium]|nr:TetR/AcrR family transcriptional regulator [Nocardioidaceae bacterium]MCL2613128.1 TetR/AcrR family transcriptional regulator [Nocardioidaceae bacterium]